MVGFYCEQCAEQERSCGLTHFCLCGRVGSVWEDGWIECDLCVRERLCACACGNGPVDEDEDECRCCMYGHSSVLMDESKWRSAGWYCQFCLKPVPTN